MPENILISYKEFIEKFIKDMEIKPLNVISISGFKIIESSVFPFRESDGTLVIGVIYQSDCKPIWLIDSKA